MATYLNYGVIVQPYRARSRRAAPVTTLDVAHWLEDQYHLYETFHRVHEREIVGTLTQGMQEAARLLIMSGRRIDPFQGAAEFITAGFQRFISSQEAERVGIPGTPTQAALKGISHRLKHPYRKANPRRPSFRDTGNYMNSSRAWFTGDS